MTNKQMIIEKLAKLRQAIDNWEITTEDVIEEIIEIELMYKKLYPVPVDIKKTTAILYKAVQLIKTMIEK